MVCGLLEFLSLNALRATAPIGEVSDDQGKAAKQGHEHRWREVEGALPHRINDNCWAAIDATSRTSYNGIG